MSSYEERLAKRREKYTDSKPAQESTTTPAATNTSARNNTVAYSANSSISDRIAGRAAQYAGPTVDEAYITSFLNDAQRYSNEGTSLNARIGYDTISSIYNSRRETADDLQSRSWAISRYLEQNKDSLPEEYYTGLRDYLDNFDRYTTQSVYSLYRANEYYSQFESEEQARIADMSAADVRAEMDRMASSEEDFGIVQGLLISNMPYNREYAQQDGRDMAVYDEVERNRQYISRKYGITFTEDYMANNEQLSSLLTQLEEGNAGNSAVAYTTNDGQNVTWQMLYDSKFAAEDLENRYGTYSRNADWAELSQGIEFSDDTKSDYDIIFELSRSGMPYDRETAETSGVDMTEFDRIEAQRQYISEKYGVDLYSDIYNNVNIYNDLMGRLENEPGQDGNFEHLSYLTDQEKEVLNYIYHTEGREAALVWHNSRMGLYEDRFNGIMVEQMANVGAENKFWGSTGALALEVASGFEYLGDIMTYAATGELGDNTSARAAAALQSGVMESVNWEIGNWDAFDFIYGAGMSGVSSATNMLLFGPMGGTMMGLGAAAQATNDALDRGMNTSQAFWTGVAAGVFEGLFESWSIGNFNALREVASANGWDIAMNIGKAMLVNASEETLTEIANITYDSIMNGDFSQYETLVRQYVVSGMSEQEAKWKAAIDLGVQVVESGASGALMGFGFGVTGSGQAIAGNVARSVGSAVQNNAMARGTINAEGGVDALMAFAREVAGVSSSDMQNRLNQRIGKVENNASVRNVRNLYNSVNAANRDLDKGDVSKSLIQNGISEDKANAIAEAIVASSNGKILTAKQQNLLESYIGDSRVEKALEEAGTGTMVRGLKMGLFQHGVKKGNLKGFADASRMMQELPGQEKASAPDTMDGENKNGAEVIYEVSTDGVTKIEGEEVQLNGIRKMEDGSYRVAIGENESTDGSNVKYASKGQALVYESYTNLDSITDIETVRNMSAEARSSIAMAYDSASNQDGKKYVLGANLAFYYGYKGISHRSLKDNVFVKEMTPNQVANAYNEGRKQAQADRDTKKKGMDAAYQKAKEVIKDKTDSTDKKSDGNHAILEDGITEKAMTKQQRTSYKLAEAVANSVGTDVHVYLGGAEQGKYEGTTGEIWLNLNANHSGQSMMAFTLGHELVHMAKQWSEDKYQAFVDFLLDAYGEKGVPVEQLVQNKIDSYKEKGETLTREAALEEVICDSCQRMLLDTNAVQEMAEFKKAHPDIVQAIKDFIKEWLDKIREAFKGAEPGSMEAEYFSQLDKGAQEIAKNLFVDMVMDAGDRLSTIREAYGKGTVVAVNETGEYSLVRFDENTDVADVTEFTKHSYSSLAEAAGFVAVEFDDGTRAFTRNGEKMTEVTVEDIENSPIGAFINFSLEQKDISKAEADRQKKMFADICTMACKTNDFSMTMQFVGSAVFTGMKANADKQYGTTYDFPSICTKTQAVIDVMSAKMVKLGRGLNTDEITEIYREVFASGNPVPCPECYVFSRWIGIGGLLDNIKKYQDYYGSMTVSEAADAYRKMRAEIEAFAKEQGLTFGKAKGALTSKLTKEFNKLTEKVEKATNQGEVVKDSDRKRLEELEPMMNTVKAMTWLENVYFADSSLTKVNKNFRVPNEVLFDLNNGEAFAAQYKNAWAFRTTQGAGYGKAITPYAEARLGEGILVTNNTTNAIKGKAQGTLNNFFLKQNGKMDAKARDALMRARLKQKNQAFIGGQRFQSTSDARYENASDYLLAALEMQAMHGMVQVYTKVDGAVPAFSAWNMSINQSLMPLGGGLDSDGNVKDTSVGGMSPKVAFANRDKHETAGTITIGVNDNHIRAMFKQWVRDFIIPYHASGGKADVVADFRSIQEGQEKRGKMVKSTDYSRTQSDKVLSDDVLRWQGKTQEEIDRIHALREARIGILTRGKVNMDVVRSNEFLSALFDKLHGGEWDGVKLAKSKVESQIYPNEFWNQDVSYEDSAQITEDYLQYCEDLGFLHRFSGLVPRNGVLVPVTGYDQNGERVQLTDLAYKYDENGNKTGQIEEFFWKVLTDRRMYDNSGKYLPQKVVTLNDTTTDTVTEFAKNNSGRQYDKQKAIELAKKIAGTKYSIYSSFYSNFDAWDGKRTNITFTIGKTSDALKSIGMKDQEIKMHSGMVISKMNKHKELTRDIFRQIPALLEHPIIVQFSDAIDPTTGKQKYNDSITVIGDLYAQVVKDGKVETVPVLVALNLVPTKKGSSVVLDFAVVKSAYTKDALQNYLNENSILYIDPDKKRTDSWLSRTRLSLPVGENRYGSIRKIAYVDGKVKVQSRKNMTEMEKKLFAAGIIDEFGNYINNGNSMPGSKGVSSRQLLADAFEDLVQTPKERELIDQYRAHITKVEEVQNRLTALRSKISQFTKANGDRAEIARMNETASDLAKLIDAYDRKLLDMEASKPLRDVVERAKSAAYQEAKTKGEKRMAEYKKAVEARFDRGVDNRRKAAMRQKVRRVIRDLDKLLNRGNKNQNVKEDMKNLVAETLKSAEILFIDNYTNADMVRDGVGTDLTPEEAKYLTEAKALMEQIENLPSGSYDSWQARQEAEDRLKTKLSYRMTKLRDVFVRERARINKTQVSDVLGKLAEAYKSLEASEHAYVKDGFHENVYQYLLMLQTDVGGTIVKDMSLDQMEELYKAYTMVLTTIRNANKAFKTGKNESIAVLGNRVMEEVKKVGGKRKYSIAGVEAIKKFGWNNLKPVYAFEHIGSDTFAEVFRNVRAGEDVWALDVTEARAYYLEKAKKYQYNSWDFSKRFNFTSSSGMDFSLGLEQIMSLYAYSKRDQAAEHLKSGGIVIDETTEVTMKTKLGFPVKFNPTDATAYNISEETLADIVSKLTPEQRAYVDEMQEYLSTTMGEKGNEVSMELYGVKLFKEKFYFPLKSASQFMAKAKEQQQGEVKIKNSGFSKETVKKASNPIVLTPFMNVWANHVNEMSMYHAFVLPMEDFYRVYNYRTPTSDSMATESVEMFIQNAYGKGATQYIDQLLKDLNGGARTDSTTGFINKAMGMFKKGAVFASASVVIQQPSAVARAAALIDLKYFDGYSAATLPRMGYEFVAQSAHDIFGLKKDTGHDKEWAELKEYAPVAIIKEMGYFDTNMGKSTQDYILGKEYDTFKEKVKGLAAIDSDYRDEVLSKAPALADEVAWCSIWRAVKRETKANNPGMDVKSNEFLKKAGERFTEVIVKTQVYDSVLSRSANMRSKDTGMKMATAFMAEPTTSINMVADALLKGKRDGVEGRRYCRKAIGAVVASQILNSFLVAWVYAARDDDEDESFTEKWISQFVSGVVDGLNPLTYIPFIKDVVSIVQGYDVERSDMAVISDLWNAWKQLKNEDVSVWRKVENFAGSIFQIFGLPVKNIMRDLRAVYQAFDTIVNGENTTAAGIAYAVSGALTGKTVSNKDQLYDARVRGSETHAARVAARYEDEDAADSAVRSAIRERFLDGEIDALTARNHLITYAGMDVEDAHWLLDEWKHKLENESDDEYNKYDRFYEAVQTGSNLRTVIQEYTENGVDQKTLRTQITEHFKPLYIEMSASERAGIKGYLINALELCGKKREDAVEILDSWDFEAKNGFAYSDRKSAYLNGDITAAQLRQVLIETGGYSEEDADAQIEAYNWEKQGYENVTAAAIQDYNEFCAAANVPKDIFLHIRQFSNNTENDVDEETGRTIYYSAMKKVMAEIDAQPGLTPAQKTAIARSLGWSEKNIDKYKLW